MAYPERFDDGIKAHITPRGHCLITINWWAQPARRSRAWYDRERRAHGTDHDFQREYEIDWRRVSGDAYFPEFKTRGEKFYVHPSPGLMPGKPVFRGWDFGTSRPAVVWGQIDDSGRVWVMRELAPSGISIHEFRDLILYASGQLGYGDLVREQRERALEIVADLASPESPYPPLPWFEAGSVTRFIDYAGPEATAPSKIQTKTEKTDAQVLASRGVHLRIMHSFLDSREQVMRALLMPRSNIAPERGLDGWPGILWDPACVHSIYGMLNGLTRKKDAKGNPVGHEFNKVGLYDDLYDATSFWLTQEIDPSQIAPDGTIGRYTQSPGLETHYAVYQ